MMTQDDLKRAVLLDVDANGNVFIRRKGSGDKRIGLPVFSTDTEEQAMSIQARHCRRARDGSGRYTLNAFSGDVDDLTRVAEMFRETWGQMQAEPT